MDEYSLIDRTADMPEGADYAVTVTGAEMEPAIRAGETVYVSRSDPLSELDIGLFLVDGKVICRRWCEDYSGALLLICDNPQYTGSTVVYPKGHHEECTCLGKVLLPESK